MRGARFKLAGIELEDANGVRCRCALVDAQRFALTHTGQTNFALDGTPHTATLQNDVRGKSFGIKIDWCPDALFDALTAAINDATASGQLIAVEAFDDAIDIRAWCYLALPDAVQFESVGGGFIKNLTLRFIAVERITT